MQEYTTEFQRLAVTLDISLDNQDIFTKYVVGLHRQIQIELSLYKVMDIYSATITAMAIMLKNKPAG